MQSREIPSRQRQRATSVCSIWSTRARCYVWLSPVLQEHRGLLTIRYPMEHGMVRNWNDMERIWQYVYSKDQLQTFSEEVWQPPFPPHTQLS